MDMTKHTKKQTDGQLEHRRQWILDTVRENQSLAGWVLTAISEGDTGDAILALKEMHKSDQDALLQENGILKPEQIELLK